MENDEEDALGLFLYQTLKGCGLETAINEKFLLNEIKKMKKEIITDPSVIYKNKKEDSNEKADKD